MRAVGKCCVGIALVLLSFAGVRAETVAPGFPGGDALWFHADAAQPPSILLYFFWSKRCPHCLEARPQVEALAARYPWLSVASREVYENEDNRKQFIAMARLLGGQARSVPTFMLCGEMHVGWSGPDALDATVRACRDRIYAGAEAVPGAHPHAAAGLPALDIPLLGKLDAERLSLPLLTVVLAGLDAFNPCAFFVLLFLLSMLVHLHSRRMMLLVGGLFVLVSGLVYFAFMAAWLNVFLVFGELKAVTLVAGLVAVVIALINIKDYLWFRRGVSLTLSDEQKLKLSRRSGALVNAGSVPALLVSTLLLAAVANLYELLCTAGFPMVYTRILTLNGLSPTGHYLYLGLYNLVYVLPLLAIVALFVTTLGARRLSESEARVLKLLSGLMMLALGLLLLVAPERLNNLTTAVGLLGIALIGTFLVVRVDRFVRRAREGHG